MIVHIADILRNLNVYSRDSDGSCIGLLITDYGHIDQNKIMKHIPTGEISFVGSYMYFPTISLNKHKNQNQNVRGIFYETMKSFKLYMTTITDFHEKFNAWVLDDLSNVNNKNLIVTIMFSYLLHFYRISQRFFIIHKSLVNFLKESLNSNKSIEINIPNFYQYDIDKPNNKLVLLPGTFLKTRFDRSLTNEEIDYLGTLKQPEYNLQINSCDILNYESAKFKSLERYLLKGLKNLWINECLNDGEPKLMNLINAINKKYKNGCTVDDLVDSFDDVNDFILRNIPHDLFRYTIYTHDFDYTTTKLKEFF